MNGTPPPLPGPGWYQDPDHADQLRWWNGEEWSEHRRPESDILGSPDGSAVADAPSRSPRPLPHYPAGSLPSPMPSYPNSIPMQPGNFSGRPWAAQSPLGPWAAPQRLRTLSLWILIFGIGYILVTLAGIGLSIAALSKIGKPGLDGDLGLAYTAMKHGADPLSALYSLSGLLIMLPLGIISLVWFHRAYQNLARRGFHLRFGTGWAIGAWFIPVFNWIRPKSIANDLYRADLGSLPDDDPSMIPAARIADRPQRIGLRYPWTQVKVSPLFHWWWLLYIIGGTFSGIGYGMALGSFSAVDNYMRGTVVAKPDAHVLLQVSQIGYVILIIGYAMMLAAAVLYLMVVQKISEAQDRLSGGNVPVSEN